ncbi:MAG TPA: DUF2304 domain-containing protein [Polyangia bacterium]|nr:DUF2304 domain-containing protein [Polyangia bacterium]
MTNLVQVVAVLLSSLLLLMVLELVRRRMLVEEYSFVWIIGAACLLVLSLFRGILHTLARWLGIFYPPSLLLLVVLLLVFVGLLSFSVVISKQRAQITRLFEEQAILAARLREIQGKTDGKVDGKSGVKAEAASPTEKS